jgi:LPPG:FO 2-phospho-L-lactate transferase
MLRGLGLEVSAYGVAQYYDDLIQGLIIDTLDTVLASRVASVGIRVEVTNTIMRTLADKKALAHTALAFAKALRS